MKKGSSIMISYTDEKKFTKEDVEDLFLSVGWISGQYPTRLYNNSMGWIHACRPCKSP